MERKTARDIRLDDVKPGILILEMRGITKRFPGVLANDHIDFDLKACEVHALLGENGAGKSTLMNILYGLYHPDEGEIRVLGKRVTLSTPKDALQLGFGMVHQHFTLIPNMSVSENIVLGLRSPREPLLDLDMVEKRVSEFSKMYNLKVDPKARVEQLSVGERQRVEIIKALYRGAKILILDEPTAVLTPQETEGLFNTLRSMVKEGLSVIFITHKLPEVMVISDRVTVLRKGKVTARIETKLTNPTDLAEKMVGRGVLFSVESRKVAKGEVVLKVDNLSALNDKGGPALRDVSFSVSTGEILGIAGVAGNGQRELAEVLTGMRKATQGKVYVLWKDITNRTPREIIEEGVADIPDDRLGMGLVMDFSVAENLILETRTSPPFSHSWFLPWNRRYFLDSDQIRKYAEILVKEYDVATTSVHAPARNLSGGNIQRLLLAKVLSRNPKLLLASKPTAGLDVGATEFIWKKLIEQKGRGVAVLLISEDLNEIMSLSDRIAVMYEGRIAGIVPATGADVAEIGLMMAGMKGDRKGA